MTDSKLTALAEHYSANFALDATVTTRSEIDRHPFRDDDFDPIAAEQIVEAHTVLTERAAGYAGKTLTCRGFVSQVGEAGGETMLSIEKIQDPDDIDSTLVCLAAEYAALWREASSVVETFAGILRIKAQAAKETAK